MDSKFQPERRSENKEFERRFQVVQDSINAFVRESDRRISVLEAIAHERKTSLETIEVKVEKIGNDVTIIKTQRSFMVVVPSMILGLISAVVLWSQFVTVIGKQ